MFLHSQCQDLPTFTEPHYRFPPYPSAVAKAILRVYLAHCTEDLILIVGKGFHSMGNPKLKPELLKMLSECNPPLNAWVEDNAGRIRVSASSIRRWKEEC